MTREAAIRHIKGVLNELGRPLTKIEKDAFTIAYNSIERMDAIARKSDDADKWEIRMNEIYQKGYDRGVKAHQADLRSKRDRSRRE